MCFINRMHFCGVVQNSGSLLCFCLFLVFVNDKVYTVQLNCF